MPEIIFDTKSLVEDLADSADDTGCSGDLVVVSKTALNALLEHTGLGSRTFDTEEEDEE